MIRLILLPILFCLTLGALSDAHAQTGGDGRAAPPSAWGSGQRAAPGAQASPSAAPVSEASGWWRWLLDIQQKLHRQLAQAVKDFKAGGTVSAGFVLVAVSFLYGVFHAAGPGHGKAVISAYVVANGATVRRGILLSFAAAFVQALSAIAIVGVFAVMLNAAGIQITQIVQRFELASGLLIALTGLWLLVTYVRRRFALASPLRMAVHQSATPAHFHGGHDHHDGAHGHHNHHHHEHSEDCGCGHAHMPDPRALENNWSLRNAAAIVFAIGVRPCTGAILVLVFALTQGIFWAGVAATFAMAIGTAITVSALAVLAVGLRDVALRFADSRWSAGFYDFAAIAGSLLVMLIGAGLFVEALGPAKPF